MPGIFIIAEAGVNHNGSLALARKMVDVAASAGCDAVKFQTFQAKDLVSTFAAKAAYQIKTTGASESQLDMIQRLQIDLRTHQELIAHCQKRKIMFLSSPFDMKSVDLLVRLKLKILKIPSGGITDLPYLRKVGALGKRIILSTGMADMKEVGVALEILLKAGARKRDITLLHCHTDYPTRFEDVNLSAMVTMHKTFGVKVGYSDHTPGIEVPVAAAALGAVVIEKHFTLDPLMPGPDHKASLDPVELKQMVVSLRHIEKALGNGIKRPTRVEKMNLAIVRKSIVAAQDIKKGEIFDEDNVIPKRPGDGISPMKWDQVIGCKARYDFKKDELIRL